LLVSVIVNQVINELTVVTSLGTFAVALSAVCGTSSSIAGHLVSVVGGNTSQSSANTQIRFGGMENGRKYL
jgi:hypothetical protein